VQCLHAILYLTSVALYWWWCAKATIGRPTNWLMFPRWRWVSILWNFMTKLEDNVKYALNIISFIKLKQQVQKIMGTIKMNFSMNNWKIMKILLFQINKLQFLVNICMSHVYFSVSLACSKYPKSWKEDLSSIISRFNNIHNKTAPTKLKRKPIM